MKIKNNVKDVRLSLGLSQEQLVSSVGVTRVSIINVESSKHIPKLDLAYKLSNALKTPICNLFEVIDP